MMKEFYQQTVKEVLDRVESRETGLTSEQAGKSRERCGWNELAEGKKKSIPQIFLEQYKDFLVLILIASAIISGMLGDAESAAVILIVITVNAILGTEKIRVPCLRYRGSYAGVPGGLPDRAGRTGTWN